MASAGMRCSPLLLNHNSCFALEVIHSFIGCVLCARYFPALERKKPGLQLEKRLPAGADPSVPGLRSASPGQAAPRGEAASSTPGAGLPALNREKWENYLSTVWLLEVESVSILARNHLRFFCFCFCKYKSRMVWKEMQTFRKSNCFQKIWGIAVRCLHI